MTKKVTILNASAGKAELSDQSIVLLGSLLILVGLFLAIFGLVFSGAHWGRFRGRGGAVVIVGPFPIVFGSDPQTTKLVLILAIAMGVVMIVLFLLQML